MVKYIVRAKPRSKGWRTRVSKVFNNKRDARKMAKSMLRENKRSKIGSIWKNPRVVKIK